MWMKQINLTLLNNYTSEFKREKEKFYSTTYNTFSSSYINRCSDTNIIRMKNNLENLYKKIEESYNHIDNWLTNYIEDVENLENVLSK